MAKFSPQNRLTSGSQNTASKRIHSQRNQSWNGLSPNEVLNHYPIGKTPPLKVLDVLISLFNTQHTAKLKSVSYKTRHERAEFLRRFFRDLQRKCGFKTLPDPRNLGDRHIRATVSVWQQEKLAAATIQTYLSFLRGLARWLGKPGFIRTPAFYGLTRAEYERHEVAEVDKSWSAHGIDIDALIEKINDYDPYIGASMRLIRAFGLRRKEALMFRPQQCVVPFENIGFEFEDKKADRYVALLVGSKGGRPRYLPIDSPARIEAVKHAQAMTTHRDAHMGRPGDSLKQSMKRFMYVMRKFGITKARLGVTAHGLRHEALIGKFEEITRQAAPVRGGEQLALEIDKLARAEVAEMAEMAGHARRRASSSYCGSAGQKRWKSKGDTDEN